MRTEIRRFLASGRPLGNYRSLTDGRVAVILETDTLSSSPHGRSWLSPKRAEDALGVERDLAQAHTCGVEDGVGNRSRYGGAGIGDAHSSSLALAPGKAAIPGQDEAIL